MSAIIDLNQLADLVADRVVARLARSPSSPPELLTRTQIAERMGRSVSSIKRLQEMPGFPRAVRVNGSRPRWDRRAFDAWLAQQISTS